MGLEIYGGDPVVIATRDEILRCSSLLHSAINLAQGAVFSISHSAFDWIPNPIPNIQLAFMLPGFLERLEKLSSKLQIAAEGYFSRESQIAQQLSAIFEPLSLLLPVVQSNTPFASIASKELIGISAALAVVGLTGRPSTGKTQLIGQAVRIAPLGLGFETHQQLLGSRQSTGAILGFSVDAVGSSTLLKMGNSIAPSSLGELANRLTIAYRNPVSSIRIEAYPMAHGRQLVVYVPGTQSFSLGGANPLNLRSNLTAMGRVAQAPSEMAVSRALEEIGAGSQDKVLFVGHSQGALVAGNLATSEQIYEVSGVVSLGGPVGHLNLEVPTIALENASDPVPTLSGQTNPLKENWVTVSNNQQFEGLVDAHSMAGYRQSAQESDQSTNSGLMRIKAEIFQEIRGFGKEYVFEISRG